MEKSCSEITNLGVPLDPRMVLLARKMDLFALLHDDSHWSSEEKWNLVFPKGLSIALFFFDLITKAQQKVMELDSAWEAVKLIPAWEAVKLILAWEAIKFILKALRAPHWQRVSFPLSRIHASIEHSTPKVPDP